MSHPIPTTAPTATLGAGSAAAPAGRPNAGVSEVGLLVLGFLAMLVIAGLILFVFLDFDTDPAGKGVTPNGDGQEQLAHAQGPATTIAPDGTRQLVDASGNPIDGLRSSPGIEVSDDLPYRSAQKLFDGVGRLTGSIEAPDGVPFPDPWRLVIEPSKYVAGREHAGERQVLEFPGNQRSFEVDDLPLGAYRVFAEGKFVDSIAQEVLLFAIPDQPPAQVQMHKHLAMRFVAARGVQGTVVDADGSPVEGLPVFLARTDVDDAPETSAFTNGNGQWAVAVLPAGSYRLSLGNRQRPLIDPETLQVEPAGSGRPPLNHSSTVPVTTTLHVIVMDVMGRGLPGAKVRGIGATPVDIEVGSTGVAEAKFLVPGFYRLTAQHEALELSGKGRVEVSASGGAQEFTIICRP